MVECDLAKVEVAGSNPVSRSSVRSCIRLRRKPPKVALRRWGSPTRAEDSHFSGGSRPDPVDFLGVWRYLRLQGAVPKW